uniref:Uncharacterized protein LOC114325215 n=1 Tax=Diabrotica virgifera virgifera TaxID=50390 RepID=A0A6P7F5H7_DIAVI
MKQLETTISKHPVFKQFLYWWKYLDDILVCFTGTNRQLDQFLLYINLLYNITTTRLQNKHEFSHSFNEQFQILHIQNKGLKLSLLESMEI